MIVADVQKQAAIETKDLLSNNQQHHTAFHVDVSGSNFIDQLRDAVLKEYNGQPPDIVVNNAGVIMDSKMHDMDEHAFDWVIDVNLKGNSGNSNFYARGKVYRFSQGRFSLRRYSPRPWSTRNYRADQ